MNLKLLLLTLALMFLFAGCSGRPTINRTTDTTSDPEQDSWYCEPAEDLQAWHCVRESSTVSTSARQNRARQLIQQKSAAEAPAPSAEPEAEPVASRAPTAPPEPDYQRLMFRPDEATPIADLPESFWTIQLIAMTRADALESYALQHGLQGLSAARIASNEQIFYVLLLGIYRSERDAKTALASLPDTLAALQPWVRPVGSLQRAMRAADAIDPQD